jgi:hypothetical protein
LDVIPCLRASPERRANGHPAGRGTGPLASLQPLGMPGCHCHEKSYLCTYASFDDFFFSAILQTGVYKGSLDSLRRQVGVKDIIVVNSDWTLHLRSCSRNDIIDRINSYQPSTFYPSGGKRRYRFLGPFVPRNMFHEFSWPPDIAPFNKCTADQRLKCAIGDSAIGVTRCWSFCSSFNQR